MIYIQERETTKLPGKRSLYVTFDYAPVLADWFKQLSNRSYNKKTREWEVSLNLLKTIIERYYYYGIRLDLINHRLLDNIKIPDDFVFKTKPYKHQIEGVEYGINHSSWILGDDQGLGKTKQIIDLARYYKEKFNMEHCLIICGINSLKWNWLEEIETHSDLSSRILGLKKRPRSGKAIMGSVAERAEELSKPIEQFFIITNIETLRDERVVDAIQSGANKIEMCAIDEAHKAKSSTSCQGDNLLKLKDSFKYKIPISGTILLNSPLDAYVPLSFIGEEKRTLSQFKNFYCDYDRWVRGKIVGYKNLNILREQLDSCMLRRLKTEVLDLPEKVWKTEYVEMSDRQKIVYDSIRNELLENIDKIKSSPNPLNEVLRLRQATGNTAILSTQIQESAKLDRLDDLLEEIFAEGHKAVVVSQWREMIDPLEERYAKYNPVMYTGDVSEEDRHLNKIKFQTDKDCKLFLGTQQTMGVGLTLTAATTMIFLDSPWTMGDKRQCSDRCHRIGTTGTVSIITLVCKDAIDEKVEELIESKAEVTDYLIDGKINENNPEKLLRFLLDTEN